MANKKIFWGMLCITLTFVFVLSGCDDDSDDGSDDPSTLNGTWVSGTGTERETMRLNNGSFENQRGTPGRTTMRGTYTTNGNRLTMTATHMDIGNGLVAIDDSFLAGIAEMNGVTVAEVRAMLTRSGTFNLSGDTLTVTFTEETVTYTRT